jgi:hypothetical protein
MPVDLTKNDVYSDKQVIKRDRWQCHLFDSSFWSSTVLEVSREGARIFHNAAKIYLVDRTKPFSIALSRTDVEDRPLLVGNVNSTVMKYYSDQSGAVF